MAGLEAAALSRQLAALLGQVSAPNNSQGLQNLQNAPTTTQTEHAPIREHSSRLVIREGARTLVLEPAQIDFISAEDYYINIFTGGRSHLVRETLAAFAAQLDPKRFVRVHRSAVINVDRVLSVRTLASGRIVLELKSGHTVPVSRSRARALQDALEAGR